MCDGGNTSSYVPINSLYADYGTRCQFIIPAALLEDMAGGTIQNIKFYNSTASINFNQGFTVYMMEVDYTTFASTTLVDWSSMTQVYQGTLTVSNNEMSIELLEPYSYGGDNLMIGFQVTTWGTVCPSTNWQGENQTGRTALYNNANSSHEWGTVNGVNFIPKTTFTYEPAATGDCVKPETLVASNVTGNSATLTWTGGSGVYNIELNDNIIEENYEGYTYSLTDLAATTAYTAKVQSVCDGSTPTSGWKSVSFTTPCAPYDIPYTYGFEEADLFGCWTVISGTVSRMSGITNTGSYRLDFRGTTSNMIALPQFNEATNNLRVEFYTRPESTGGSSGKFAIGYMTDITDASTFVAVDTYNSTQMTTTYVKKTVDFVNVPSNANIAMRQFDCSTSYYWYVDDVTVKEMPSCLAPTGLAATNTTTNSTTITWTPGGNETQWRVEYNLASVNDPFSGTTGHFQRIVNGEPTYTITDLPYAATSYVVRVIAICGDEDESEPSEVFTFTTACDVIPALGYSENFDSYTAGNNVLPICWNYINTTTYSSYQGYPRVYANGSYSTYAHSAPNCLYLYSYYSSWTDYDPQPQYAILPEMTGLAGKQVTLMAKGYNASSTFKIGTMSDPTDASTFTMIAEQTLTTNYPEEAFEYIIPTTCTDSYLAIMIDAANESRTANGAYIDDIAIVEAPSCIKPTELAVTEGSITENGATITWTAGGDETNWQIEFATDADFTNPLYETVEGEPTYTFHGLDDLTTYYVHVQAVCGGSDGSSEYCAPVSFTTLQAAANLPYSNDFESENGWVFVNGTCTNAWAYGEATNNGGTHALYISNDGGTSNAYTIGSAAMVYATKLFNFEAGTYVFSYDWKANGESNYDYLRVALVPSSVILTAGTIAPSVPSGSFYNNLPTGWIALDGGEKLNLKTGWQSFVSTEIEIATAGSYMMVFAWTDDTSSGTNPPAAIDNVSIEMVTCSAPTDLTVNESATTATSVELSWTENGEATAWQIELTDEEDNVEIIDANSNPFTLRDLTSESMYAARVRAYCDEDNQSRWSEEVIFETAADCQTSDGLAAVATTNSAAISWNGYGQEEFNLRYSTDGTTWTTESRVANPYTLTSLTPATTYQVQVQPTCADAETWSATYTFHTLCESIVVTDTWSEGFEDGELSFCWEQDGNGTWTVGTGDANTNTPIGAHTGTYNAKITHSDYDNVTKLITPVLDLTSLNNPMLTFWYINRKWSNDIDGFAVYYRTASDAAWTQIYATEEAHATWTMASYVLPNPSATYQIAFEMTDGYGYGVGIDDVTIAEAPTYTKTIIGYASEQGDGGNWYLIASPLADDVDPTTVGMITDDLGATANPETSTYDLYRFDQTQSDEWLNYRMTNFNLANGTGYLYANKSDVTLTFTGAPYSGNSKVVTLSNNPGDNTTTQFAGYNLVGNPFIVNAYIGDRDFYVMNNGTEIILADRAAEGAAEYIEPMEGIFVITTEETEQLTFTTTAPESKGASLALNVSKNRGVVDRAMVRFSESRTLPKFQLRNNSTKVYISQDNIDYAVVSAEAMGELPVNFRANENGSYTLSFTSEEVSFSYLHLVDNMTGNDVDLLETPSYTFDALTTDYESRFKLVFATGNAADDSFAFYSNGNWIINNDGQATLQVIDVTGRILSSETVNGSVSTTINAAPGVYMLRLVNGDNVKVQKVVVR